MGSFLIANFIIFCSLGSSAIIFMLARFISFLTPFIDSSYNKFSLIKVSSKTLSFSPSQCGPTTLFNTEGNSNFALPLVMQESTKDKLKDVCSILEAEGVEYRLGTAGGGNQARQPYLEKFHHKICGGLTKANYIHSNALYIGNHPELNKEQIIDLCKKLNNV